MVYISVLTGGTSSILISSHLQREGLLEDSVKRGANVAKVGGLVDLFWREVEKDLKEEVEKVAITMRRERRLTVEFWWREVAELQPSKSLHETTQPFTYLGSKCQDVTRY